LEALRGANRYPVRIKCVAVWDTIGNLGIPFVRKSFIKELLGFTTPSCPPRSTSVCMLLPSTSRAGPSTGLAVNLEHLRATTRPDPLGEQVSPTSDGIYRVSYTLPFIRLIKQNRRGISALRRAFLGSWRSSLLPPGQVPVNESVHESTLARFGKRVPQRRGKALSAIEYRPRSLMVVLGK
jgi:hypothetical protein